jgi:hypothetical protein
MTVLYECDYRFECTGCTDKDKIKEIKKSYLREAWSRIRFRVNPDLDSEALTGRLIEKKKSCL